ncbi:hypothetical protein CYJ87_09660 [Lactobacillus gasseri]|nr:hypothetical protein CYJ87_09660 [Lactobacillus gasseri]
MTKLAIVTGAGQGIGKGIAERLVKDGYAIAVADINSETATEVANKLRNKGYQAKAHYVDVGENKIVNVIYSAYVFS